jgi:hypothetical protein
MHSLISAYFSKGVHIYPVHMYPVHMYPVHIYPVHMYPVHMHPVHMYPLKAVWTPGGSEISDEEEFSAHTKSRNPVTYLNYLITLIQLKSK